MIQNQCLSSENKFNRAQIFHIIPYEQHSVQSELLSNVIIVVQLSSMLIYNFLANSEYPYMNIHDAKYMQNPSHTPGGRMA